MARKRGKGRAVKNARRKFGAHYENQDLKMAPHTMVIHRGLINKDVKELIDDVRKVMEPFTATALKVRRKNTLKDFVAIAGPLHVTHLIVFTQTEIGDYMKLVRLPRGPTLHFKLLEFSNSNDVLNTMRKKQTHKKQFLHQPLLILNGFSTKTSTQSVSTDKTPIDLHQRLLITTLQNMFPSINVTKVELENLRRCVLFNYNKDDKTIDFRQYNIRLMPVGLSKPVKKLVQEKIPDLSKLKDISEFIANDPNLSESEAEIDDLDSQITAPKTVKVCGSTILKSSSSSIRLLEIGPRLKLKLIKIEEGVCDGEVLYHDIVKKTPEELKVIREKTRSKKKILKNKQQKIEEDKKAKNVKNKTKNEDRKNNQLLEMQENIDYYKQELGESDGGEGEGEEDEEEEEEEQNGKRKFDSDEEDEDEEERKPNNKRKRLNKENTEEKTNGKFEIKFNSTQNKAKFFKFSKKKSLNLK